MESAIVGDKGSTTLGKNGNTKLENNYLCRCQDYSMTDGLFQNTRIAKGGTPLPPRIPRVRKHERIHHHINTYDDWYRLIKATGKFVGSDNKSANYHLEMGYDNLYNITSKKMTMTQTNLQFAGTLSAGHEFNYTYSDKNPMQLASVETKQYNVDGEVSDVDAKLADNQHVQNYEFDANGNMTSVSVASLKPETQEPETTEASEEKDVLKSFLWDEENRLLAVNNNGSVSCYFYDAAGERTVKLTSESEMVHVNGKKVGGNANICKFTAYVSPYFVVSNGGAYTKHIYAASQRIASKLGNEDGFGADPRRVEMAGGKKISDIQKDNIGARYKELGFSYSAPEKEKVEKDSTMDSEEEEKLIFFYHPDHLGSTSYVTDADGNIAQHVEYIPYGEVFVEERNSQFSTNFLFNAKELDNETGLYYYGARYLDPTGAMWLSVDPMWENFAGMSPYNYCMGNPIVYIDPDGSFSVGQTDGEGNYICDHSLSLTPEEIDLYKNLVNNFENIIKSEDGKGYDETLLTLISDICGLSRDQIINDMKPGQGPTVLFRDGATEGSANGIWVNFQIVKKLYAAVNSNETINRGGTIVTKYEETLFLSAMEFLHEYIHNGDERTNGQITGQWTMKGGSKVMEQDSNGNDQPLGKQKDGMSRTGHRGNDITTYGFGCNVTEKLTKKGGYFIDYVGAGFNGGKIGKTIKSVTNKLNNVWRQKK